MQAYRKYKYIIFFSAFLLGCAQILSGCGKTQTTDDSDTSDITPAPASEVSSSARAQAAAQTAQSNASCVAIQPFYWEIGSATGTLASGSPGNTYNSSSLMAIASSTKWLFGAYVIERRAGSLTAADEKYLQMVSGYHSFSNSSCLLSATDTVGSCFHEPGNDAYTASDDGNFFYNSGHFQKWGVDNGLANYNAAMLATEFQRYLGADIPVKFISPLLAGGGQATPATYAAFLRKILSHQLRIGDMLGKQPVCTDPSTCSSAVYSPVAPEKWHYSYGHWVEDDPAVGDGAFSSPGRDGFYPWIDASRTYYGLVARFDLSANAYWNSVVCGRILRKAYLTGIAQ